MGFFNSFKKKPDDDPESTSLNHQKDNQDSNLSNESLIENKISQTENHSDHEDLEQYNKENTNNSYQNEQCLGSKERIVVEMTQEEDTPTITHSVVEEEKEIETSNNKTTECKEFTNEDDNSQTNKEREAVVREIKDYSQKIPTDNSERQTKIISILNQKGGVGKSTTAINLSAALGVKGKQCLLIDLDPQGNTSSGLGIEKSNINKCIYDVLLRGTQLEEVIIPDVIKGVDIVPATINLAGAEVELVSEIAREQRLKQAVTPFKGKYDYIFIDCPPSLGLLTVNALVAADRLLIPIQCEFYALEGVTKLLDSMKRVKSLLNPELDIFGVVLTMYDNRTTLSKQVAEEVCQFFGDKVFESKIPRTVKISEAPSFGIPINEYEPLCKGSIMYESLAEEVIDRG